MEVAAEVAAVAEPVRLIVKEDCLEEEGEIAVLVAAAVAVEQETSQEQVVTSQEVVVAIEMEKRVNQDLNLVVVLGVQVATMMVKQEQDVVEMVVEMEALVKLGHLE